MTTGELIWAMSPDKILKGSKSNKVKFSYGEPTFTGLFLDAEKIETQDLTEFNIGSRSKTITGIGVRKLSDNNFMVIFGRNKKLVDGGGYDPNIPGNGYAFYGGGSKGNRTHFGYFMMDENGKIVSNEGADLDRFELFKKHFAFLQSEKRRKSKFLKTTIFQNVGGFHLITYDPYESIFKIF